VIQRVAEENAQSGAWDKFVRSSGGEVGVAGASKDPKVMVGRKSAVEGKEGGVHVQGFGGEAVDEVGGCSKGISPI
jgi:hypothetical protein